MINNASLDSRGCATSYAEVLNRYADQQTVTVAAGVTCAYLGDERNLREFLIADEIASSLRRAGHIVTFLLVDDSLDPLSFRQLRVGVDKDPELIKRFEPWCGKAISQLPDPWGRHESYAAHFEEQLLARLHRLGCYPTLVATSRLYERGRYAPYVRLVLERYDEILTFLSEKFPTYTPEKLFWVMCPQCRYLDQTRIIGSGVEGVVCHCDRCERTMEIPVAEVEGKLNWKLDCAVRWVILGVDIEPFTTSYLEPGAGSFWVAQELAMQFFGGRAITPFQYGTVSMERQWSYKLLEAAPPSMLREIMVARPASDLTVSRDLLVTAASRHQMQPDLNFLDFVRQLLPMWLLAPEKLSAREREYMAHGIAFGKIFLDTEVHLRLPARAQIEGESPEVLRAVHALLQHTLQLREGSSTKEAEFETPINAFMATLGSLKGPAIRRLRLIVGQQQGLPATRFLFVLPLDYLSMVEWMLHLYLDSLSVQAQSNAVSVAA